MNTRHRAPPRSVIVGILDVSFYAVVGEIVVARLRHAGQRVTVVRGEHGALFPLLAHGDIDVLVLAWLPDGHQPLWDYFGRHARPIATVYKGARLMWSVTPGGAVRSVHDLRLTRAAQVGRRILTIGASSSITTRSRKMLDRYDLQAAGFHVETTDSGRQHAALRDALSAGRSEVFALWTPHFITALHGAQVHELDEPLGLLGGANDATIVLSGSYAEQAAPEVLDCLRCTRLPTSQVAAMDVEMHRGRRPAAIATDWLTAAAG